MPQPLPELELLVRTAIMDAIDDMIRERAAGPDRPSHDELAAYIGERNRVAAFLGRPTFDAVGLLRKGTDD
jgi:hypothetical protein